MGFLKGRILYTEDDPDSRDLVTFILRQSGYHVTCTENATEALTLAKNEVFDLFLVDNQTTPILFYSAAAYDRDKASALDAGAQAYLTKPDGLDDIVDEVDRLISGTGSHTEDF
jgi:two-component system, OmpR family, KDP operon response regulator KdpE